MNNLALLIGLAFLVIVPFAPEKTKASVLFLIANLWLILYVYLAHIKCN